MAEELTIASTTDPQQIVESAVQSDPESGRAEVAESSLADFRESESADGQVTTSVESPESERNSLLERLAAAEREIQLLPEALPDQGQSEAEVLTPADRELIRQVAVEDAIAAARNQQPAQDYFEPPPEPNWVDAEMQRLRSELEADFGRRLRAVAPPDLGELVAEAQREGTDISGPVRDTLQTLPGGPQATIFLLQHPEERQKLARLPSHIAQGYIGQLSAHLAAPPKRARSNAPEPINPVGGSSTKSSVPMDQLDYQTFSRLREQQEKNRYRRR